jgi:hypothetical protein
MICISIDDVNKRLDLLWNIMSLIKSETTNKFEI